MGKKECIINQKFVREVLDFILDYCKSYNTIPIKQIIEDKFKISVEGLNKKIKKYYNYDNYRDYCHSYRYKAFDEVAINNKICKASGLTLEDIKSLISDFNKKFHRMPTKFDFTKENNLIGYCTFMRILRKNDIEENDFYKMLEIHGYDSCDYQYWLNEYKRLSIKKGMPIKWEELRNFSLPSAQWFIKNSDNPKVTNFNTFIELEAKLIPTYGISKEFASLKLIEKQKSLTRPLLAKDLGHTSKGEMSASIVRKFWGSFDNMRHELKLNTYYRNTFDKIGDINYIKRNIVKLCNFVYETEGRIEIKSDDWNLLKEDIPSYGTCNQYLKQYNSSIRDFIESIGYICHQQGVGMNKIFDSGESCTSQFEISFTEFLNNNIKLEYNKDYFRSVRYKEFVTNYNGLLDCDYVIHYNDKIIYIEIAGMLRDWKNNWRTVTLKSKSKTKYINHLKQKEKMFIDNNLNYYILFPSDIKDEDFLMSIFK